MKIKLREALSCLGKKFLYALSLSQKLVRLLLIENVLFVSSY